jgi:hypothetical protein
MIAAITPEVALLAHLLLDETRLDGWTEPDLSPEAAYLREVLDAYPGAVRALGYEHGVRLDLRFRVVTGRMTVDEARVVCALAAAVDVVRAAELADAGPVEAIARQLGARVADPQDALLARFTPDELLDVVCPPIEERSAPAEPVDDEPAAEPVPARRVTYPRMRVL